MDEKVCLVTGVGPGTGAAISRRFAAGGYRVAMLARDGARIGELEREISGSKAYGVDVADEAALRTVYEAVCAELGQPEVVVNNAVRGSFGSVLDISASDLEQNFRVNALGLLHITQLAAPAMLERGTGAIIVTGNTSATRGKATFAAFAPTKAAQRILAESMARSLGPKGIHVAYIMVDAVIDVPWTRQMMPDQPDDYFVRPDAIAETIWTVVHQDRSAWSFDVDLRPFGESW